MPGTAEGAIRSIKIIWELVDKVTAPARKIDEQVSRMLGKGGEVIQKYEEASTASTGKVVQAYQDAETAVDRYTGGLKSRLTAAAKDIEDHRMAIAGIGVAFAGIGYVGINYYSEGLKDFADYQDAYNVMVKNVTGDTDDLISKMREAADGTLTDTEMVLQANKAMLLGIGYEDMPRFIEASRAAARILGEDQSKLIDSLVSGTGRRSALRLDDLGILTTGLEEFTETWAETHNTTVSLLTSEQEGMIYLDYVLEHSDDLISKVDWSQQSLNETLKETESSWSNVQSEMAEGALPAYSKIIDANVWLANLLDDMPGPMKTIVGTGGLVISTVAGITGAILLQLAAIALIIPYWEGFKLRLLGIIPASISAAYAEGGLTAATWALGASLWAIATNPITLAILAIVGAIWLLWDVFDKGWEDSMLGQAVAWLYDTFPWLEPLVEGVAGALKYLQEVLAEVWSYIEPIVESITGALENPAVKLILDAMWATTPMGITENVVAVATGKEPKLISDMKALGKTGSVQDIADKAYTGSTGGGTTVVHQTITVDASMSTGDLKTEGVTKEDLNSMMDKRDRKMEDVLARTIRKDFRAAGA